MNQTMVGKPPTLGEYYCIRCFNCFQFQIGKLICPDCSNKDRDYLVIIDVREVVEELMMRTKSDCFGG